MRMLKVLQCEKILKRAIFTFSSKHFPQFFRVYNMKGRCATVTYPAGATSVGISFHLNTVEPKIDRVFNLSRSQNENLESVLTRIKANIEKCVNKKKKKKEPADVEICIKMIKVSDESSSAYKEEEVDRTQTCVKAFVEDAKENGLLIGSHLFTLDVNPPTVTTLDLPKNIMAGYLLYPSKFETQFAEVQDCQFQWFRSNKKYDSDEEAKRHAHATNWTPVGTGFVYNTQNEDIGHLLKVEVEPGCGSRQGDTAVVISPVIVTAGPGICPFERRHVFTTDRTGLNGLRVVCYNILADLYADSEHSKSVLFPTCPPYALAMDYRKQLLLKEITGYNGDLICLQEVDQKLFLRDLEPALNSQGYAGLFDQKGGQVSEGIALFYRTEKFRMLSRHRTVLSEELQSNELFLEVWERIQSCPEFKERLLKRTTTLQAVVLQSLPCPDQIIVVGGIHLYFHPDADHIRVIQAGLSMKYLQQVMAENEAKFPEKKVSLLFCGDFNSTPEFGVLRFMTTQVIDTNDPDWSSSPAEKVKDIRLTHDLTISSACGTPSYTNYTAGFSGCLDYIFYQADRFTVEQVIPFPSHEEVTEHIALPSVTSPSDHIALVADLAFIPDASGN